MTEKKATTIDTEKVTVVVDERKVTWGYTRKANLGNYQSEDVSIYLTDFAPKSTKNMVEWMASKTEPAINEMKAQVWGALGLEFSFDEAGTPNLDTPTHIPGSTAGLTPPASGTGVPLQGPPPQQAAAPPPQQPLPPGGTPSVAQVGYYAETPQFCKDCGQQGAESFYDNRVRVDENITAGKFIGPDFKCKNCDGGNGKTKPIYRPGSYNYNQALKGGQTQGAATAPPEQAPF